MVECVTFFLASTKNTVEEKSTQMEVTKEGQKPAKVGILFCVTFYLASNPEYRYAASGIAVEREEKADRGDERERMKRSRLRRSTAGTSTTSNYGAGS